MMKPIPDNNDPQIQDKEKSRGLLLMVGMVIVVIGCVVVVSVMSEEGWSRDAETQQRVAVLATLLLLTSLALCYFALRSSRMEDEEEGRRILLIRPRNYSTMKSGETQPYWMANCVLVSTLGERGGGRLTIAENDLLGILTREEIPRVHGVQANG